MLISLLLLLNVNILVALNTLRPRRNGQQFPDDIFKRVKMFEFQLKFHWSMFAKGPINNIPALVHIMAWRLDGTKALFEPMMVTLQMHISVTQPHCVNSVKYRDWYVPLPIDLGPLELPIRILGLCPANERRCYFIATSLIGWAQVWISWALIMWLNVTGYCKQLNILTLGKMATTLADDIFKCISLNENFWIWIKFHWNMFLRV